MSENKKIEYEKLKDSHGRNKIRGPWTHDGVTERITFAANHGNHVWTDDEIQSLLRGESIMLKDFETKAGVKKDIVGKLDAQRYMGKDYIGFTKIDNEKSNRRLPDVPVSEEENQMEKE